MSELTGELDDDAAWEAAGVKERDQRTTPPVIGAITSYKIQLKMIFVLHS